MFHFRLFREKTKKNFFQKTPLFLVYLCRLLGKTECSSKFCSYQYFLKKFGPSIIVSNFEGKVMSGFQATLVSEAHMHTCMEKAYHKTLHDS